MSEIYHNYVTEIVEHPCSHCGSILKFSLVKPIFAVWQKCTHCQELVRFDVEKYKRNELKVIKVNKKIKKKEI